MTVAPSSQSAHIKAKPSSNIDKASGSKCEFCNSKVKPENYSRHLKKEHGKQMAVNVAHRIPVTLTVHGIGKTKVTLTSADLSKLPQQAIRATDKGMPVTFEGVRLSDVLSKVKLPTGDKFLNTASWYYVLVEALDGNRAVFAWAELDSSFMDRKVYVITRRDGESLPKDTGPFQLMVPGEKRTTRWVRQVTTLRIKMG